MINSLSKARIEIIFLLVLIVLPFLNVININVMSLFLIYAIFALSVDFIWGYAGLLSFGQAVFFGIGAYTTAMLKDMEFFSQSFIALPIATIFAALIGFLLACFLFLGKKPISVDYFPLLTLAIAFLCERLVNNWSTLGGYNGIPGVPYLHFGSLDIGSGFGQYFLILIVIVLCYMLLKKIIDSNLGMVIKATRHNEQRVAFLGYNVPKIRIFVFTISTGMAGMAGMLFAANQGYVSPSVLGFGISTEVLIWVAIGGRGTLLGAVIGAIGLSWFAYNLSGVLANVWFLILGAMIVVFILFFPKGILGGLIEKLEYKRKVRRVNHDGKPIPIGDETTKETNR